MSLNFFVDVGFDVFPTTGLPVKRNHLGLRDFVLKIRKKPKKYKKTVKNCKNKHFYTFLHFFEIFPVKSAILNGKIAKKCKKV